MTLTREDPRIAVARSIMFVRDTDGTVSHIAFGWDNIAMCGAAPTIRGVGWTLGAALRAPAHPLCPECRTAYAAFMAPLEEK